MWTWFTTTKIPVMQAWSFDLAKVPGVSIHLADESEDESKASVNDYFGQEYDEFGEEVGEVKVNVNSVSLDIGIHADKSKDHVLWIYYIINYIFIKEKLLARKLGLQLITFRASEYNRESKYMADNVWSRWIRFRCTVQNYIEDLGSDEYELEANSKYVSSDNFEEEIPQPGIIFPSFAELTWDSVGTSTNYTSTPTSITRTTDSAWNMNVFSEQTFKSGDGYIEWTAGDSFGEWNYVVGLSAAPVASPNGFNSSGIEYGVYFRYTVNHTAQTYYQDVSEGAGGALGIHNSGDIWRMAIEDGSVKLYKNSVEVYEWSQPVGGYPLHFTFFPLNDGSEINNIKMYGDIDTP
jgi:hypothetical protein